MSDQKVSTEITANADQAQREWAGWADSVARASASAGQAINKVGASTKSLDGQIKGDLGRIENSVDAVAKKFTFWFSVIAGGGAFKSLIQDANAWNLTAGMMAMRLGVTTEQSSILNVALKRLGIESETFVTASEKMSKQIFSNRDAFKVLGVQVQDAEGHYRPIITVMAEVNSVLAGIRNPIEQNIAGQQVYGKGWAEVRGILRLTSEQMTQSEARARELGLIVGPEGAAMSRQYTAQMRDLALVGKSLEVQFGNKLLPVFTMVGATLSQNVTPMVKALATVLETVVVLGMNVSFVFTQIAKDIAASAQAFVAMQKWDFSGARSILNNRAADAAAARADVDARSAQVLGVRDAGGGRGFINPAPVVPPDRGPHYEFKPEADQKDKKDKAPPSFMAYYEAALEEEKRVAAERDALHEYSKAEELAFWRNLLANADLSSKDRIDIQRKASKVEIEILRDKARQAREINAIELGAWRDAELSKVEMDEQAARNRTAQGLASQEALLLQEQAFEQRRRDIKLLALQESLALLDPDRDAVKVAQMHAQIEALEQQHQLRMAQIKQGLQADSNRFAKGAFDSLASGFESVLMSMGTKIKTLNQLVTASMSVIVQAVMQMGAKMVAEWIKQKIMMMLFDKTAAASVIGEKAAEAGAGGVASMAAAPFPINLTAPEFGAAMSLAAMAFAPVASAARGFDIPAGLNPMTQLHAREMVLPAQHADVIRALSERPALLAGGGGGDLQVNVRGASAGDFFMIHKRDLVAALRSARKDLQF